MKQKILVINASKTIAQDIAEFLKFEGYDLLSTSDALAGVRLIYEFQPELVICSFRNMDISGYEIVAKLRSDPLTVSTQFILLAGRRVDDAYPFIRESIEAGVDDVVLMPFTASELLAAIQARFKRKAEILGMPIDEIKPFRKIKHHIFLSYSREDMSTMLRIREDLRNNNLSVWTDENLQPGTPDWTSAIASAIENTGGVVIILSPSAKKSEWVNIELAYAKVFNVPIFPILARGDQRDAIPMDLIRHQFSDIRFTYDAKIQELIHAIRKALSIIG